VAVTTAPVLKCTAIINNLKTRNRLVFGEIMTKLRVLLYNDSALIQPRA